MLPEIAKAKNQIKTAWIAGLLCGSITLLLVILSVAGYGIPLITAWSLIDVILVFGLTFGIYKKSRVAAAIMFLYFLLQHIIGWIALGHFPGIIAIAIDFCFFRGIQGTFNYHAIVKSYEGQDLT